MRQIVLDTETTGLEPKKGHRIIEIGCVEMVNRRKTRRHLHHYLNPQREVDEGALEVHGLGNDFLADKPLFSDVAQEFIDFIRDAELIIHNAPFDVEFIDMEFSLLGSKWGKLQDYCTVTDTLVQARELHPGQKNSLDALCSRYEVDNSGRDLHGALLDAEILLDVYLAMTRSQATLSLDTEESSGIGSDSSHKVFDQERPQLRLIQPDAEEIKAHENRLNAIEQESDGKCLWKQLDWG